MKVWQADLTAGVMVTSIHGIIKSCRLLTLVSTTLLYSRIAYFCTTITRARPVVRRGQFILMGSRRTQSLLAKTSMSNKPLVVE